MMFVAGAFGTWLIERLADAARSRSATWLLGSEQQRALRAAGQTAIARTAAELRPDGSDDQVKRLAAILDQVFKIPVSAAPLKENITLLQELQAATTAQLAVLGDPTITGTEQSSVQALNREAEQLRDLSVEQITRTLVRNVLQEVLQQGTGGGALAPLANQLNFDLTHLQGRHTADMLSRIVDELALMQQRAVPAQPVPRELPRPTADFTGRGEELATLRNRLAPDTVDAQEAATLLAKPGRPVVISAINGMAGIGKSALAIQAAHELTNAGGFPDGQLYVNLQGATPGLAPLNPLEALGRMLRALGVEPAAIPTEVEEAAARFRSMAAEQRLLVLLDNAGVAEQVRPLLPASPTCAVLVTSRQVLPTLEGAHQVHLDVLPREQALELLGRIAGPERIAAEPQAADEVVQRCGRLPLAIRIVGARLAARPAWSVAVIAERLADATRRLEELAVGDLEVRASFEVSLHTLLQSSDRSDQATVAAFGLLSTPDGPDLSLAAAAKLLDQPQPTAQTRLERLVDAQLLDTPHPGRYQFHDLVRLYARERASKPERLAALTRLFGFYTATAWRTLTLLRPGDHRLATADPLWAGGGEQLADVPTALVWLEAERPNLLAAITQAAGATPAIPAGLPGQLTRALFGFFQVHSYWQDCMEANQTVLQLARRLQDHAAQASAHHDLGAAYRWLGRYPEAIASLQDSLTGFQQLGDRHGQAYSLAGLGVVYELLGRSAEAIAYLQDSLALRRELNDRQGQAASLGDLGNVYWRLRQHKEALACQQDSLTIYKELGDRHGQAVSLTNLGSVYRRLRRYEEALACQQGSLTIYKELGDRHGQAVSLTNLAAVYLRLRRYEEALACQQGSLTIYQELDDLYGQAEALRDLGYALEAVGRHQPAQAAWRDALAIFEGLQIPEAGKIRALLAPVPPTVPGPARDG